ncbi:hypothetical protein D9M69_629950 [compost metagenome]
MIGLQPVLPHHHRVNGQGTHPLDKARQVMGDLCILGLVATGSFTHRTDLAGVVDFHHIGRDHRLRRAPDQPTGHQQGQAQATEGHQPPVARLREAAAHTPVPDLRRGLVGRDWLRGVAVAHPGTFESHLRSPSRIRRVAHLRPRG